MVMPTQPAMPSASSGGDCGEQDAALLRHGGGKKRERQRHRKRQHGDAEVAPAGAIVAAARQRLEDEGNASPCVMSERDARGVDDFAEDGFGLLGFFLRGDVARADHHAVREHRHDQALEIVGQAVIAAFEKRARLRGAMQHHGAARADAQAELFGLARALDDFERVVEQAVVHFHLRDGFLHGGHVGRVHQRLDSFDRGRGRHCCE